MTWRRRRLGRCGSMAAVDRPRIRYSLRLVGVNAVNLGFPPPAVRTSCFLCQPRHAGDLRPAIDLVSVAPGGRAKTNNR